MKRVLLLAVIGLNILIVACTQAKKETESSAPAPAKTELAGRPVHKDADELEDLQQLSLYKFMASEQMKGKAITAPVKNLSDSLKILNAEKNAALQALATRKDISLPIDISADQKRKFDRLMKKDGILFCKEYVRQMREQQEEMLSLYEDLARDAQDAEIKNWAQRSIPEAEKQLRMIEQAWEIVKPMRRDYKYDNNTYL